MQLVKRLRFTVLISTINSLIIAHSVYLNMDFGPFWHLLKVSSDLRPGVH